MERIYLDYQNQAVSDSQVVSAVEAALRLPGNPSSPHREGRGSSQAVERARALVAGLINASAPKEITFTSSGTEANGWALGGLTKAHESRGRRILLSAVEHLSVLHPARRLEKEGWQVTVLPVDRWGRVSPDAVEEALTPETVLVSIQWANGEVGTLQPIAECVRRVKGRGILFHCDAVAAVGQVPIDLVQVPVDALSLAANTFGGPAGIGALFLRKGVRIQPLFVGGAQEEGRRAGTENLLGIVGMGKAAELAKARLPESEKQLVSLRDRLIRGIMERLPQAVFNGHPTERLPGHVSVSFPGADAEALVLALDLKGVAVGIGSACTSRTMKASQVLKAMGIADEQALGTITCTLGPETTEEQIDRVLEILPRVITSGHPELVEG
ncbi:MAG: cysteine desulfurase [Candidatus Omnitrophica bacterium]|nr:cysteine desulfurase [Candidatus Omnitrophota bacterium]